MRHLPDKNAPVATHPRVCRVRDLLAPNPDQPLVEIRDFKGHVFGSAVPPDGGYYVVQGMEDGAGKRIRVKAYDCLTGKVHWSHPVIMHRLYTEFRIDPRGEFLSYLPEIGMDGRTDPTIVRMPHGQLVESWGSASLGALGPGVKVGAVTGRQGLFGLFLADLKEKKILVNLDLDRRGASAVHHFNATGTHLAWGTAGDGAVLVCDLPKVKARLDEVGLGW
jgi:hypothetical protein